MIDWQALQSEQNEEQTYSPDWANYSRPGLADFVSELFDGAFSWVNDAIEGRYTTLEAQRKKMLAENPQLAIQNRDDGFEVEAERLLAIQQKNSRGFNIYDINPGLLTREEYPLSIPYEFIFDGTNFMPDTNESLVRNFRTINIPIAGNFLKIEFIYENNSRSNIGTITTRPYAQRKYSDFVPNEADLRSGKASYSMDNYARTKVFVNFASLSEKPFIVARSGDSFNTYFSEVNISVNIGCPKIRVIIGMNSEKHDGPSVAAINAKPSMTGSGRLFSDIDTTLSPFSITENDNVAGTIPYPYYKNGIPTPMNGTFTTNLITNDNAIVSNSVDTLGYSVLWITRMRFRLIHINRTGAIFGYSRVSLFVANAVNDEVKRYHQFVLSATTVRQIGSDYYSEYEYTYEPCEPMRVVIPSGCALRLLFDNTGTPSAIANYDMSFTIDGYSLGELLAWNRVDPPILWVRTSKFVTDATFLSDLNRVENIQRIGQ